MHARTILSSVMLLVATSTFSQQRPHAVTNPIIIESQISEVKFVQIDQGDDVSSEAVLIHLIRQPYDIIAPAGLRVPTPDGTCIWANELRKGDNVRVEGHLERKTVTAMHITLQLRIEHLPRK
ncbi:MAG TPA: hypothetical protein VKB93_12285 [Thermoanaerobaculia bacterium]|nr:hypothetical protein [Thermoanaerobaculia bacterium]